jgi:hypothetical protein
MSIIPRKIAIYCPATGRILIDKIAICSMNFNTRLTLWKASPCQILPLKTSKEISTSSMKD